jgi:ABC-type maltose transport system permease subunit
MSTVLALSRPSEWNFPLFIHVLGAMVLVGALLTAVSCMALTRGDVRFLRLGYWTLLAVGLPAYVVMRIGAEWIADKEGFNEEDAPEPAWLGIGYIVADVGALLILIALIVGGIGMYRMRGGRGQGLLKATMVIATIVLAAAVVAIWAMAGKPD